MKKRVLHLPVKAVYFYQVKDGSKPDEYRLQTDYWRTRLVGRTYDEVHIKLGYPKKDDHDKIVIRPWKGYEEKSILHEHFGNKHVDVFAIKVN